ncbi:MAG: dienelactone hydrolase family protein [Acidobacteria bacterium]|nr:dienelactone hydrolase family protein [Acidobacteriota bacterium]
MYPEIRDLYGRYVQGALDRREFLRQLARLAGGAVAAAALLPSLTGSPARAAAVPEKEARLHLGYVAYPGPAGDVRAYLARPRAEGKRPGVIIIHENRGLEPHIEDVARRVALAGFLAVAPDALSPLGGTPADEDKARDRMRQLDGPATIANYVAAVQYLKTHPQSTGKVGCMGFCWGGGMTNQVAVRAADLTAAVPFYGRQPAAEDVPRIRAALLLHYAGDDPRINEGIPAFEAALKTAGVEYTLYMYAGARHAFFNDSRPERYHAEAARLSWERTIAFFKAKLKG